MGYTKGEQEERIIFKTNYLGYPSITPLFKTKASSVLYTPIQHS